MKRWGIHFGCTCPICRKYGPPWRLQVWVPGWYVGVALRPKDRFARTDTAAWVERREVIRLRSRWFDIEREKS